jgi:hypothetical protein
MAGAPPNVCRARRSNVIPVMLNLDIGCARKSSGFAVKFLEREVLPFCLLGFGKA